MTAASAPAAAARHRRSPARRAARIHALTAAPAVALLVAGVLVPIAVFFVYSFWSADLFSLVRDWQIDNYRDVVGDPFMRSLIWRTLATGAVIALITVAIAYFTAYALAFSTRRWRDTLLVLIVVSMLASYLVRVFAWKLVLGPEGVVNRALEFASVIDAPLDFLLFGRFAVVVTLVHVLLPIAILPIYAAMQSIDRQALEASRDLGAGALQTLARVALPLSWPGVRVAFVLVFILAASDFVTPQLVGGKSGLMVGRVVYDQFGITHDWPLASALAFTTIAAGACAFLIAAFALRVMRRVPVHAVVGPVRRVADRAPRSPRAVRRVRALPWATVWLVLVMAFLFFPLVVVAVFSFSESPIAAFPIRGLTLDWYADAFGSGAFQDALGTSIRLAVAVTVGALLCGVPAAFALRRGPRVLAGPLAILLFLPLVVPSVMLGFSILTMVTEARAQPSLASAWLAQTAFVLPFVVLVVAARLQHLQPELEEAARDLGSTPVRAFARVTWPLIRPTVVGVAVLVFSLSMDEFIVTLYTIGSDVTLPILIWTTMQRQSITPTINAIATVLVLATILGAVAAASGARLTAWTGGLRR